MRARSQDKPDFIMCKILACRFSDWDPGGQHAIVIMLLDILPAY